MRVELPERKRREDMLTRYNVIKAEESKKKKSEKRQTRDEDDYDDDYEEEDDDDGGYGSDFDQGKHTQHSIALY